MKKLIMLFAIAGFFLYGTGCAPAPAGHSGKVPPGQMKKATGSKSAKPFAPGQRK
jgi:hypothetical protein